MLSTRAAARLGRDAKLYAADPGLVPAFAAAPRPAGDPEVRARVFEAAVFRHLREVVRRQHGELAYARLGNDLEIDFVILRPDGAPVAVEVTSSQRPEPAKLERLRRAADRVGAQRRLLVHGGLVEERADDVKVLPIGRFLAAPATALGQQEGSGP